MPGVVVVVAPAAVAVVKVEPAATASDSDGGASVSLDTSVLADDWTSGCAGELIRALVLCGVAEATAGA
jgi:hypothetical protein